MFMKYLMKFNESSLKSLYDTCLVELYDDGFKLSSIEQKGNDLVFNLVKTFIIKTSNRDRMKWVGSNMGIITGRFTKDSSEISSSSKSFSFDYLLPYQKELLDNIDDTCNKLIHTFNCSVGEYKFDTSVYDITDNDITIFYKLAIELISCKY